MITIDNPYRKLLAYHSTPGWPQSDRLDEFLKPSLELQAVSFRDGALMQLMFCLADLRNFSAQQAFLGNQKQSWTIIEIAQDWEKEIQAYMKI